MRRAIVLTGMAALVLAASGQAASLNKCIDAKGKVTYSNLPCHNAREARTVEIAPAPRPDPVRRTSRPQPAAAVVPKQTPAKPAFSQNEPPPPQFEPVGTRPEPEPAAPRPPTPKPASSQDEPATLELETRRVSAKPAPHASARQCGALADKLGRVFDKMDAARRKGYTQAQMNAWNEEVQDLERKKQQSGCF